MRSLFVIVSVQLDHGGLDQTDVGNASSHFPLSLVKIFELGPQRFAQDCSVDSASCSISRSNYKTTVSRPNPQGIVCTATQPTAENRDLFILFLQLHSNQPFYPPPPTNPSPSYNDTNGHHNGGGLASAIPRLR